MHGATIKIIKKEFTIQVLRFLIVFLATLKNFLII
jgi:hypothetical protein